MEFVEYAVLLALIVAATVVAIELLAGSISGRLSEVENLIEVGP
jgi:Flp pilus assembly pilin Flp